jgi:hypothetical protein
MNLLREFLSRNILDNAGSLPMVHTCESFHLKRILRDNKILSSPCNVFEGEDLTYFFVGRPAYKKELELEPRYWELPTCIICKYDVTDAHRIFPFDSGGFSHGKYPNFISMANLDDYEVSGDKEAAPKIIGTFFSDRYSYYHLKARPEHIFLEKYAIDVLDEEIRALHALITTRAPKSADDRRASIEVSFNRSYDLVADDVLAIVIPEIYLESNKIMNYIENELNAEPISYPILMQNVQYYYYCIYGLVEQFYQRSNYFRV